MLKKIGLLLGDEDDWPLAFEAYHRRMKPSINYGGKTVDLSVERVRIHPFNLRDTTSYNVVVERLGYWHHHAREWLKKAILLNDIYTPNSPFTFQSWEKHSAYTTMIRLGLNIPDTWLIPAKRPPKDYEKKYRETARRYHDLFDLPAIAQKMGYPMFMKPYDGGGWRGVTKLSNQSDLQRAYDESGEQVMHLQQGLLNFDVFVRALAIGPQVMTMKYDPDQPPHARYQLDHNFLDAERGKEVTRIIKTINSFFRWDFNSCESILKNGVLYPIDFANACPDIAVNSLHFYFPWAIGSLWKWSVYCAVTERKPHVGVDPEPYYKIAASGKSYNEKLIEYEKLADAYFETEKFKDFCAKHIPNADEVMADYCESPEFDQMLTHTITSIFPRHEHDKFIAHFRGLVRFWAQCWRQDGAKGTVAAPPAAKADAKPAAAAPAKPAAKKS